MREKCPYTVFLVFIFPRSDWIRRVAVYLFYSVQMRRNTDQKNSEYGHFSPSEASINKLSVTVLILNFTTPTFIISPSSSPKTFNTILSTLNSFKFNFLTLRLHTIFMHHYQKVCNIFTTTIFNWNCISTGCSQQNIFYIICKGSRCLVTILMWFLILTVLTLVLILITVLVIVFKIFCENRNIVTTSHFLQL